MSEQAITSITDLVNLPNESHEYHDPYVVKLPDKYRNKFIALIDEMEEELHEPVFIQVKVGTRTNFTEIYPTKERQRLFYVAMTDDNLTDLNGKYSSVAAIKHRIMELIIKDIASTKITIVSNGNTIYYWKCPYCESYGTKHQTNKLQIKYRGGSKCGNCKRRVDLSSKYHNLKVFPDLGCIGIESSGSIDILDQRGKLTIEKY